MVHKKLMSVNFFTFRIFWARLDPVMLVYSGWEHKPGYFHNTRLSIRRIGIYSRIIPSSRAIRISSVMFVLYTRKMALITYCSWIHYTLE